MFGQTLKQRETDSLFSSSAVKKTVAIHHSSVQTRLSCYSGSACADTFTNDIHHQNSHAEIELFLNVTTGQHSASVAEAVVNKKDSQSLVLQCFH